jgi:hypothetical protein
MIRGGVMDSYSKEELAKALQIVSSAISRCEKAQPKFVEGTAQYNQNYYRHEKGFLR